MIILPKNHAEDIFSLPDEDMKGILCVARKIAAAQKKVFGCDGVNILQNNGEAAGQTVFLCMYMLYRDIRMITVDIKWLQRTDIDLVQYIMNLKKEI